MRMARRVRIDRKVTLTQITFSQEEESEATVDTGSPKLGNWKRLEKPHLIFFQMLLCVLSAE